MKLKKRQPLSFKYIPFYDNLDELLFNIKKSESLEDCFLFLDTNLYLKINEDAKRYITNALIEKYTFNELLHSMVDNQFIFLLIYSYHHRALFNYCDPLLFVKLIFAFKHHQLNLDISFFEDQFADITVYRILSVISNDILNQIINLNENDNDNEEYYFIKKIIFINFLKNQDYYFDDLDSILSYLDSANFNRLDILFNYVKKDYCIDYILITRGFVQEKNLIHYISRFFSLNIYEYFNQYEEKIVMEFINNFTFIISELFFKYNWCVEQYLNDIIYILNYNNFEKNLQLLNDTPEIIYKILEHKKLQKNLEFF